MASALLSATSPLHRLRAYPKLKRKNLCILVPQDAYHVQKECVTALQALGHKVVPVALGEGTDANGHAPQPLGLLLRAVALHRPDMLLSINYLGFDRANRLAEVLEAVGLPCAVWFVDSPLFFAMGYLPPSESMTRFFSWDRSHQRALHNFGAQNVQHLPLACDPTQFAPSQSNEAQTRLPVSFVGSSLVPLSAMWRGRLQPSEQENAQHMAMRLLADRQTLHELVPTPGPPIDRNVLCAAYANCLASRIYRRNILTALPQDNLFVFGDSDWQQELPAAQVHGPVAYGAALARLYQHSDIVINATIYQMPTAVNQRVFDAPAAGAFVLSDAQSELEELFVLGQEAIAYDSPAHLVELTDWWGKHAKQRAAVVQKAQQRIHAEHTYVHRMQSLLRYMRAELAH